MKKILFFLLVVLTFASCSTFPDGTSVWSGGAWLAFWLPVIGAGFLFYFGRRAWKSGTITGGSSSNPKITYSDKRLPWYKVWQWVFAAALILFAIIVVIVQNVNK